MTTQSLATTASKIRDLLQTEPEISARQISALLGISRQRVYVVVKKAGINLKSAWISGNFEKKTSPPAARIKINGSTAKISHTCAGTVSELLVAADLIARGFKPYAPFVRQRSHDLIAVSPSGKLVTIEVRAGYRKEDGTLKLGSKPNCQSDILASVFFESPVVYVPELPA